MRTLQATRRADPVPGMLNQGEVLRLDARDLLLAARASLLRSGYEVIHEDRTRVWGRTTDGRQCVAIAHAARSQIDASIRAVLQEAAANPEDLERAVVMPAMPSFRRGAARIDPEQRAKLRIGWLWVAGDGSVEYHAPPAVSLPPDDNGVLARPCSIPCRSGVGASPPEAEEPPPPPPVFPKGLASQLRNIAGEVEALVARTPVHVPPGRPARGS